MDQRLGAALKRGAWFALAFACVGACDRIAYYSVTGSAGPGDDGQPDDDGPSGTPSTAATGTKVVTRGDVLEGVATCAVELYAEVSTAAKSLDTATKRWESDPSEANAIAAREAWSMAIGLWQQAEVLRIGPAGPLTLPKGEGTRDFIYSWPLVSRCLVEQNIVSKKYAQATFVETGLVNTRGLVAAEYLTFYDGSDNGCTSSSSINANGTWAALGSTEIAARKRAYAAVVAADLVTKTAAIEAGWKGDDGFASILGGAGSAGSPFDSDQSALNAVSDGIFYVEREVKDMKLARPLGKTVECTEPICPDQVESLYARVSRDHVRNNLLGFRRVFEGCDAAPEQGFDDLLRSVGSTDLADRMSADLAAAIATADGLPSSDLGTLLVTDLPAVEGLYTAVKRLTDALKTDFVTVLDLELPKTIEGDND